MLLEQSHLTELRRLLNGAPNLMSFGETCGLFAAVATAPHMVAPGRWLDLIKGKHIFEDSVEVQRFTKGVMALYNEMLRSVAELGAHCCPDPADRDAVRAFCRGYLRIALEDATWEAEPRAYTRLLPMMAIADLTSMDKLTELSPAIASDPDAWLRKEREDLGVTLVELYDPLGRRA